MNEFPQFKQEGEHGENVNQETQEKVQNVEQTAVMENPRIKGLKEALQQAEKNLQEALHDLETREQSPAFQKAKVAFDRGVRMYLGKDYDGGYLLYVPSGLTRKEVEDNEENKIRVFLENSYDFELISDDVDTEIMEELGITKIDEPVFQHLVHLSEEA